MKPRLTFMDCDGVIFDTNRAKAIAFVEALGDVPAEARERFARYQSDQGGVSRYVKFRHFFESIHPVDDIEAALERALTLFAERSRDAYRQLVPRAEALQFASELGGKDAVYVVSGADQQELRSIFESQGIADRFADVLGSPTQKPEHVARVLAERQVDAADALFIGDGRFDFETARGAGMPFLFLAEMSEWSHARDDLPEGTQIAATWADALAFIRS